MDTINTESTSWRTANADPIVLRETEQVRLVFVPTIVANEENPRACVRGEFVYQKKKRSDQWEPANKLSLGTIKQGEAYKLELHAAELYKLGQSWRALYELGYAQEARPGRGTFVRVEAGLSRFFALGVAETKAFFDLHPDGAIQTLTKIVSWLAASKTDADKLASLSSDELPSVSSLLGLATLKKALTVWRQNGRNDDEEFWQQFFAKHSAVLSQILAYPVVVIAQKAYVGGKRLDNTGGKLADFIAKAIATHSAVVIDIKTPRTRLLGAEYRDGIYPLSAELNGAIAQVTHYKQTMAQDFHAIARSAGTPLVLGEPRAIVIAGNAADELSSDELRTSFAVLRERVAGVTVVTFDELFARVQQSIGLLTESATL